MDAETKKPKRATRSQPSAVDEADENAAATSTKSKSRPRKSRKTSENEGIDEHHSHDDFDDAASSSSDSVRSCKVILQRENFDEILSGSADGGGATVARSTRARSASQLTEANVAALNPARRALRSASIASDGTGSTKSRTTRSTGLAASQNTPKKESSTPSRPATPSRRSSRLRSENEKAVDSPAKPTPSKRNLRSNSVVSVDDTSPPQPVTRTRSSNRLSESQGTPSKALKTQVSKIKTEPTTPRRGSSRFNKSSMLLPDIIDEESSDDDKPKKDNKKAINTVPEEEKTVDENVVQPDSSMQVDRDNSNDGAVAQPENISATAATVSVDSKDEAAEPETVEPSTVLITVNATGAIEILETNTPTEPKSADTPTIESVVPMEISTAEHTEEVETSNEMELGVVNNSDDHESTTNKPIPPTNEIDSKAEPTIINEEMSSAVPEKVNHPTEQQPIAVITEATQVNIEAPTDMDTDEVPENTNIDDTLTEILKMYSPKPKSKPRQSDAFKTMDVSALVIDEEVSTTTTTSASSPAPVSPSKQLKVASKRLSLNSSVQSTGFDKMDVSALAMDTVAVETDTNEVSAQGKEREEEKATQEVSMKEPPPSSPYLSVSEQRQTRLSIKMYQPASTPKAMATESPKSQTPKVVTPKAATPKSVTSKPNAMPQNTPIAVQSAGSTAFNTPTVKNDFENSFERIANDLTPGPNESAINRHIADIVATMSMTVDSSVLESTANDANIDVQVTENIVVEDKANDQSIRSDQNDASVVDKTQPDLDETTSQTEVELPGEPKSISKSARKSVQIMTPQNVKNENKKRCVYTPYPTAATINDAKKHSDEAGVKDAEVGEKEQKFGASWSKPIRQVSLTYDSPKPIDTLGADKNDKTEDAPQKSAVPARNNWSVGLVDSDSEEESIVPDSDGDVEDEQEDEQSDNEFINDEAEEAGEDYQSGDSMDEDERRELNEHEIVENGEDLGSEDSDEEGLDDDYDSNDSFIVKDESGQDVNIQYTDDEEEEADEEEEDMSDQITKPASSRTRRSRMIVESSSDDSNMEDSIDVSSNDLVSVSVQADSVVVIVGSGAAEEKIVEGKTFATTYLLPKDDEQQSETSIEKIAKKVSSKMQTDEPSQSNENDQVVNNDEPKKAPDTAATTDTVSKAPQDTTQSASTDEVKKADAKPPKPDSDAHESESKQKISSKKQRASLPGINPLSKASAKTAKKANRMSLGDLNPNQQHMRAEILNNKPLEKTKTVSSKNQLIEKEDIEESEQIGIGDRDSNMDASTSSVENMSPNRSRVNTLNVSSQEEENNNRKSSAKKPKADETIQKSEIITTVTDTDDLTASVQTIDGAKKKKARSKRKFEEVDIDDGDQVRAEPKKLLKVISTASGIFLEEPVTPEKKNKFAFQVTPLTPVNHDFRVHRNKVNKRKSIYIQEDDPIVAELLPKPKWKINTQFDRTEDDQPRKRARKLDVGASEVILKPLESKKKSQANIPEDIRKFRQRQMYRSDLPREDKRAQLRQLYKKRANFQ